MAVCLLWLLLDLLSKHFPETHIGAAVQGIAALIKQLHLTHKATEEVEEASGLWSRHVVASGEHEGGLQWFKSHTLCGTRQMWNVGKSHLL